jgi:hypothetical protein
MLRQLSERAVARAAQRITVRTVFVERLLHFRARVE